MKIIQTMYIQGDNLKPTKTKCLVTSHLLMDFCNFCRTYTPAQTQTFVVSKNIGKPPTGSAENCSWTQKLVFQKFALQCYSVQKNAVSKLVFGALWLHFLTDFQKICAGKCRMPWRCSGPITYRSFLKLRSVTAVETWFVPESNFCIKISFPPILLAVCQDILTQKTFGSGWGRSPVKIRNIRQQMGHYEAVSFCRFQLVTLYIYIPPSQFDFIWNQTCLVVYTLPRWRGQQWRPSKGTGGCPTEFRNYKTYIGRLLGR